MWPCAFVAFIPLFSVLRNASRNEALFFSYFSGLIFFSGSIYWLTHVSQFGCIFLILYFALFWGLFGILGHGILIGKSTACRALTFQNPIVTALILSFLWTGIEVVRAQLPVLGFGWVLLGFSQSLHLPFIQIADCIGVYGVSFLVMVINVLLYATETSFKEKKGVARFAPLVMVILLFILMYSYGNFRLRAHPSGNLLRVGIVQGNIAQADKWNPVLKEKIIEKYAKLVEFISYDGPELIILPEASYPGNFKKEFPGSPLQRVVQKTGIPLLIGAIRFESAEEEYNSSFLISGGGDIVGQYDKIQLVPFGEYVPWKRLFSFLGLTKLAYSLGVGDFKKGKEFTVFTHPLNDERHVFSFSTLICFEDIFPALARTFVAHGAQFLVVITNDAWFGKTGAAAQHVHASVFRALENNCYVIRSANTGISAFISPRGNVMDTVHNEQGEELFVMGGITRAIFLSSSKTFYQSMGFVFKDLCLLFLAAYVLLFCCYSSNLFKIKKLHS